MTAAYKTVKATLGPQLSNGIQPVLVKGGMAPAASLVADLATAATAYDTFAAAALAITGDTYSTTTKQFTYGGATGLTHAQVVTVFGLLDTFATAFLAAQADAAGYSAADVQLTFDATNVPTRSRLRQALDQVMTAVDGGYGGLTP